MARRGGSEKEENVLCGRGKGPKTSDLNRREKKVATGSENMGPVYLSEGPTEKGGKKKETTKNIPRSGKKEKLRKRKGDFVRGQREVGTEGEMRYRGVQKWGTTSQMGG